MMLPFGPGGMSKLIMGSRPRLLSSIALTASFSAMPNMPTIFLYFFVHNVPFKIFFEAKILIEKNPVNNLLETTILKLKTKNP